MKLSEKLLLPVIAGLLITLAVIMHAALNSTTELTRQRAFASGARTESEGGVRVITDDDGTMYLTTETTTEGDLGTSSQSNRSTSNLSNAFGAGLQAPPGFADTIGQLINSLLTFVMLISALLVLFFIIWGAFEWITSGGDKGKIDQARQKIIAAVVGIIVVASTYAIFLLVINFLGFENTEDLFENLQTIQGSDIETVEEASPSVTPATDAAETDADGVTE